MSNTEEILSIIKQNQFETMNQMKINTETILLEVKNLNTNVNKVESELENLKIENDTLKKDLMHCIKKINSLESQMKAKNIILFGLDENINSSEELENTICEIVHTKLNINFNKTNIEKTKRIGRPNENKTRPVVISLNSEKTKHEILKNTKILKGTNLKFEEEFTKETLMERQKLIPHLLEARNKGNRAFLRGNKLSVNNVLYSLQQLSDKEELPIEEHAQSDDNQILEDEPLSHTETVTNIPSERKEKEYQEKDDATMPRNTKSPLVNTGAIKKQQKNLIENHYEKNLTNQDTSDKTHSFNPTNNLDIFPTSTKNKNIKNKPTSSSKITDIRKYGTKNGKGASITPRQGLRSEWKNVA